MLKYCYLSKYKDEKGAEKSAMKLKDMAFEWSHLLGKEKVNKEDIRFTLYDTHTDKTVCLFIDVDNIAVKDREKVVDIVSDTIGPYQGYYLDTGGGIHAYFPIRDGFLDNDFNLRRDSYDVICDKIDSKIRDDGLTGTCDRGVFSPKKYGRMVGVKNSKYGTHVKLIDYKMGPWLVKDYLGINESLKTVNKDKTVVTGFYPDAVIKHCRAIQDFKKNTAKYGDKDNPNMYDLWFKIGSIFNKIGRIEEFANLSTRDVEDKFDYLKEEHMYGCRSIQKTYSKSGAKSNPCEGCPHNKPGNAPAYISGKLPTPSRKVGFVINRSGKKIVHGAEKVVKPALQHDDVVNHFINTCTDEVVAIQGTSEYYSYNGKNWEKDWDIKKPGWSGKFRNKLYSIPFNWELNLADREKLVTTLIKHAEMRYLPYKEFNKKLMVAFSNKAFNITDDLELIEHHASNMNTSCLEVAYDETAEAPKFEKFLEEMAKVQDGRDPNIWEDRPEVLSILKIIMGLTVSNIPPHHYQKFFWLHGRANSGKSVFTDILKMLVGHKGVATCNNDSFKGDKNLPSVAHKMLLVGQDLSPTEINKKNRGGFGIVMKELVGEGTYTERIVWKETEAVATSVTVVVTSNYPPSDLSVEEGVLRRIIPIETTWVPPEKIGRLAEKLWEEEKEGIYKIAIDGLKAYLEEEFSVYEESDEFKELIDHAVEEGDSPLAGLLDSCFEIGTVEDRLSSQDIYEVYEKYVTVNGSEKYAKGSFFKVFRREMLTFIKRRGAFSPGDRGIRYKKDGIRGWRYIKIKGETKDGGDDLDSFDFTL